MNHIVGISGGKDSCAMSLRLREVEPQDYTYIITPTGNELPEMFAHWEKMEGLLGKPFVNLKVPGKPEFNGDNLVDLIDFFGALPNWRQRWCTRMIKIEPTIDYLKDHAPCVQYVGLRADEDAEERTGIYGDIPGVTQRFPLREWGWGIKEVIGYLNERGVEIPQRTDCAFCYGQRLIEWKRLYQGHPELYQVGIELEKKTGHTFRSPGRDTWPASLEGLAREFDAGRKVRGEGKNTEVCRVCRM
jgi:3'-phosphoadenosine 5'-phosphosulfate sulfotransferase (PAPS reductase)/FAD synthetase